LEVADVLQNKMTAREIMTRRVQTVPAESSLTDALALMDRGGFGQLPVMQGEAAVALLTEADARRAILAGRLDRPVGELASPLPPLVRPCTRLSGVLAALQEQESLLVISGSGRLRGIITYWDVLVLSRPHLLVKEVELLLRRVVAAACEAKYGPDWWPQVPVDLRERAEDEHKNDDDHTPNPTPEHMLGHTSFWSLIEICRWIQPDVTEDRLQELHRVREMRNFVAHYYRLTPAQLRALVETCTRAGDWLEQMLPPVRLPKLPK
jgi:CBS domain-containing protein